MVTDDYYFISDLNFPDKAIGSNKIWDVSV